MLAVARATAPELRWVDADLATLALGERFDVVVAAGNVMVFLAPGTEAEVVRGWPTTSCPAGCWSAAGAPTGCAVADVRRAGPPPPGWSRSRGTHLGRRAVGRTAPTGASRWTAARPDGAADRGRTGWPP